MLDSVFTIEFFAPLLLLAPLALAAFERVSDAGVKGLRSGISLASQGAFVFFILYLCLVVIRGYDHMLNCHQDMSESQAFSSIYFIPGLLFAVIIFPKEAANAVAAFINYKPVSTFIYILSWVLIAELVRRLFFWGCL